MTKVFLDYSQEQLDAQYDQATLVPDVTPYTARWTIETETAKRRFRCIERQAYGPHPDEWVDVYRPDEEAGDAPIVVFFHGGAWRAQQIGTTGHPAFAYAGAGAQFIAVNFTVAPDATIDEMVRQCRGAAAFVYHAAVDWGGNPERIFLLGHSSGAHLVSNVAVTDWAPLGLPTDLVKGIAVASGPYDLAPVLLSKRNAYLHLDRAAAERNTAARHLRPNLPPAVISWGGKELAEFKRQGQAFADKWEDKTASVTRLFFACNNHFDQRDEIAKPNGPFAKAFRSMMKSGV